MGRDAERRTIDELLGRARIGRSGVVVVRGEAGIGKTAILDHARSVADGSQFRVVYSSAVEAEAQFAFAGLHQVCAPLLDHAAALPAPQASALAVTFGLEDGPVPDRFVVGLAVLNLLAEAAEAEPLVCLVDDAQWLDPASAQLLAFVARRLGADRVAMVVTLRDSDLGDDRSFVGLPELALGGLVATDARALLTSALRTPLDPVVLDQILAEARGNPLALLELPLSAHAAGLGGGFELPHLPDVPRRVEASYRLRSADLPGDTQTLLVVAAAEPTGDASLLWRAAAHLGITPEAAAPAQHAGLVDIGDRVRFCHPLARSAVYGAASLAERRRAHGALAAATDGESDADRRAWHRARAVSGPDEATAAELERLAGRARARGGFAASAAFLQQAAELTSRPRDRARRALEAAHDKHEAGVPDSAAHLLTIAAVGPLDDLQGARLHRLRAQIAFHSTREADVPRLLVAAAARLVSLDPSLARETYLHALDSAVITGGGDRDVRDIAREAAAAPAATHPPRPVDLLLDGLVATYGSGFEAGAPILQRAVQAFRTTAHSDDAGDDDSRTWLWLATRVALALFDSDGVDTLADRGVELARRTGSLATLPRALLLRSATLMGSGETARATELAAEGAMIGQAIGAAPLHQADLVLASWRGDEARTTTLYAASVEAHGRTGTEGRLADYALAILQNGRGNYPAALEAAARAGRSEELPLSSLALPEAVEAASRAGQPDLAARAVEQLGVRARTSGTPWALGMAARSRALIGTGPAAEDDYREAIELLRASRMTTYLARAHLVYGEWLRRDGRRADARQHLRDAHALLSDMGAEAFAGRAARELRATGEHPRHQRTAQPADTLTAQEMHIARLVATGATSREVGAQLFLSPRTIEAHLRSIFRKLGITSRRQLKEVGFA